LRWAGRAGREARGRLYADVSATGKAEIGCFEGECAVLGDGLTRAASVARKQTFRLSTQAAQRPLDAVLT